MIFLDAEYQRELLLWEVNNGKIIAAIEANSDTHCLQMRIENLPLKEEEIVEDDTKIEESVQELRE